MPVISTLTRLSQEDHHKFKVSLGYKKQNQHKQERTYPVTNYRIRELTLAK